jgi:hypothetical protein
VLWNEVCRDLAGTAEALRRDADEIVLADPKRVGFGRASGGGCCAARRCR